MKVLKLGGSVVTRKDRAETVDDVNLAALADAVADHVESRTGAGRERTAADLVLVHGGGSFGHHHASEHGVSTSDGSRDAAGARAIHGAMKELNGAVLAALADRDVPALPVHPLSAAHRGSDGALTLPTGQVAAMLDEGFVPVLHGDVVAHRGKGVTILSGDELVVELARALDADDVGLCSAVPGVLDGRGEVVERIESFSDVADALGGSDATDVTGGMAAKVRQLLALDAPAHVFDVDEVTAFLAGEEPGSRID